MDRSPTLPESVQFDPSGCAAAGGSYTRVDRLREFVNGALREEPAENVAECAASSQPTADGGGEGGGDGDGDGGSNYSSPLNLAIQEWNDRFFNMNTAAFRQNAVRFHGRGSEARHLAQEVSHFVMPLDVQRRIDERLETNRAMIFVDEGVGQGGTTGAHFLSGNVGFGNSGQGASIMDALFPHSSGGGSSSSSGTATSKKNLFDGDSYARQRGGNLFGDASSTNGENADGQQLAPDLTAFEDAVKSTLMVGRGSTLLTTCPTLATRTSTTVRQPTVLAIPTIAFLQPPPLPQPPRPPPSSPSSPSPSPLAPKRRGILSRR